MLPLNTARNRTRMYHLSRSVPARKTCLEVTRDLAPIARRRFLSMSRPRACAASISARPLETSFPAGKTSTSESAPSSAADDLRLSVKVEECQCHDHGMQQKPDLISHFPDDLSRRHAVGDTPLHAACREGHEKTVSLLCGLSSDVNQKNEESETALHIAVVKGHVGAVRCLIGAAADPDLQDKHGCTALHIALRRLYVDIAIMLLQDGCSIDMVDNLGDAPIHIAAKAGLLPIAQTLCAFGCKVDIQNEMGQYPLHLAAKSGHTEVVRCLCLAGCDVMQKNKDGIASEICALAQGHAEIGELLNQLRNAQVRDESISQLIPSTRPVPRVKLKLFGSSGVGKTALLESLRGGFLASWFRRSVGGAPASPKGNRENSNSNRCEIELNSPDIANEKPLSFSTRLDTYSRGIQVQQANLSGVGDVSLWEFSGHEPYWMTYDHFVGNTNCLHLVLFDLNDPHQVQVRQVLFWIAFLVARIPPQQPLGFCGRALRVALVATHVDAAGRGGAQAVLRAAQAAFGRQVDLHKEVFFSDDLKSLKSYVAGHKDKVTQGLPKSTGFLETTCCQLPAWRRSRVCFPVLPWQHFVHLVREEVNPLAGEEHMRELVQQLQVMGEVVYVTCDDQDVVVLEPSWLCATIVGHLLSREVQQRARVTGIYSADDVQLMFPEADGSTLMQVLEALELCTGCETDGEVEYEFPCFNLVETLDGLWAKDDSKFTLYGGVRLGCSHERFLAPLFPRLQVHFRRSAYGGGGDSDSDLYQWREGSKFCSGPLEALVTLDSTGEAFEIKVRGPAQAAAECFYFQEDLIAVAEQMLTDVCPGLLVERHLLSASQLCLHCLDPHAYAPSTVVTTLLRDGVHATLDNPSDGCRERLFDLAFFGAKEVFDEEHTSADCLNSSGKIRQPPVLIPDLPVRLLPLPSLQGACAALDPPDPLGRDWCMLGVLLGMTDRLPALDPGPHPSPASPTARLLAEWGGNVGALVAALKELGREDVVENLLRSLPLFRSVRSEREASPCDCGEIVK